jgi:ATP-binding cassette subfamily B protein
MAATETTPLVTNIHSDNDGSGKYPQRARDLHPSWNEVMQTIWPFLTPADWQHTIFALLAFVSIIVGKLLNVLPPLAIKYAVDTISNNTHNQMESSDSSRNQSQAAVKPVIHAIIAYSGLKALILLNSIVQDLAQRTVSLDAEKRFANALFTQLHTLSLSYHLEKHIGEITRIMNRGSDSINSIISSLLFFLLPTIFEAAVVSVVFWKLVEMPSIAVSTLMAITLYLSFTIFVTKTRIAFRRKLIEASDAVGQKETETLVNYETVAMFGRTEYEIEQYTLLRQTYKDSRVEMLAVFALLEFGQKFIKLSGTSAGLIIAGIATVYGNGTLTAGTFVLVQMYIDQLFQPLTQLGLRCKNSWEYSHIIHVFSSL